MTDKKTKFRISEEKRRILLVEDDIINQEMIRESIGEAYDLIVTGTGEEALCIIREQYETLSTVLLDLNLPGIKGVEVLKQIKSVPAYSRLPVIVMTSDSEAEVERKLTEQLLFAMQDHREKIEEEETHETQPEEPAQAAPARA